MTVLFNLVYILDLISITLNRNEEIPSEADVIEKLHSIKQCCCHSFSKRMKVHSMDRMNTVECVRDYYVEQRSLKWVYIAYHNQKVTFTQYFYIQYHEFQPLTFFPWEHPISTPPLFEEKEIQESLPNSSVKLTCFNCSGIIFYFFLIQELEQFFVLDVMAGEKLVVIDVMDLGVYQKAIQIQKVKDILLLELVIGVVVVEK